MYGNKNTRFFLLFFLNGFKFFHRFRLEIDNREIDNKEIDNREIDNREIDNSRPINEVEF